MSKPSIFSNNYQKTLKRRKLFRRLLLLVIVTTFLLVAYDKTSIDKIGDVAQNLKTVIDKAINNTAVKEGSKDKGTDIQNENSEEKEKDNQQNQQQHVPETGTYSFKLSDKASVDIVYENDGESKKITGIKPDNLGVSFDIREDGQSIVFDNPKASDIWICNIDGKFKKLNPDSYKQYKKSNIMKQYKNKYVWAARPKFLKGNKVVYQSHLPWFKATNSYYLWVVNTDGSNNKLVFGSNQLKPMRYSGFTEDGRLVVEYNGTKKYVK